MSDTVVSRRSDAAARLGRTYGLPLLVIVLFAAGVLEFATLKWNHLPADQRINNGSAPTFFAFHIGPSYNFSEDFHLYYVRARRIERRGWTDSLLYSRPDEKPNYAAPFQVLLGRLALLTEGRPRRYALFMFATLAVAWSALYLAARSWLPREISTASILLAVLLTVLFEAVHLALLSPRFESYGQWPTFRALRMSTMGWTNPLLLAATIALASLIHNRQRWAIRLGALAFVFLLLLGSDNWAFAMAWFMAGLVAMGIGLRAVIAKLRLASRPQASWPVLVSLAALMLATLALHEQLNGSLTGDALLRGGFGAEWRQSRDIDTDVMPIREWVMQYAMLPLVVVLLLSIAGFRARSPRIAAPLRLAEITWAQCRWLALLPVATVLLLNLALRLRGMECFLRSQMVWRADYCLLFALVLVGAEWVRTSLPAMVPRLARSWPLLVAIALGSLFAYHSYRMHWFVAHTARRDFFLTADAQGLRPWLDAFDRQHDQYELATASVELNFLCAFWTNADLLLPSGFPYHHGGTNQEIQDRAIQLLRLYGATQESWLRFTHPTNERYQDLWTKSRVAASGRGYLYNLFHRWTYFMPPGEQEWFEMGRMEIADALRDPPARADLPTPEIILVDDVSRALGQPDLAGYRLGHRSGSIEAWVRDDVSLP